MVLFDTILLGVVEINEDPTITCVIVAAKSDRSDGITTKMTPLTGMGLVLMHLRVMVVKE